MSDKKPILEVRDLTVNFGTRRHSVSAVAGISFDIYEGETLGLVGESGCGKSTTGKALMRIVEPASGSVVLDGVDVTKQKGSELRRTRTRMQMIFQDPISSLNPRRRVKDVVAEPLDCWGTVKGEERDKIVTDLLNQVGIDPKVYGNRYPRTFSGGQCQRISIARSLAMRPKLLICDEMVSALDVSVQAQILNPAVHRPRPRGGEEHFRPRCGDVLGQVVRDWSVGRSVLRAGSPVHEVPAGCRPGGRPGRRPAP
jgi:peptide/nickel transport system ATP-binding protein